VSPFVPRIKDVGIVLDSAIHDIGVVRYLVGRSPVCIYSRVGSVKHLKEDHAIIVLDFETAMASIEVNWLSPHKARTLVATGSEGTAFLDYIEQKLTIDSTGNTATVDVTKEEPLKLELEDFLSSVGNGTMPAVDGKEGLEVLKIAQEACNHDNYASQLVLHH
jgi:UDP-N-acetylglucosamine 3-dehydrogenase